MKLEFDLVMQRINVHNSMKLEAPQFHTTNNLEYKIMIGVKLSLLRLRYSEWYSIEFFNHDFGLKLPINDS